MHNTPKHKKCCRGPRGLKGPRGPPGPFIPGPEQLPSVYVFNSNGDIVSNSEFLQTNGKAGEEFHAQYLIPRNGELQNLYVEVSPAVSDQQGAEFTVRINEENKLLFTTVSGGTKSNDTFSKVMVSAGDRVSIIYNSETDVKRKSIASFELK